MHSFAPFFNLKISAKNRQHVFAIEKLNFRFFSISSSNFAFFLRNFDEFFSGFRAKLQKRVRSVAFQSILRKRIRKLPKFLKILKIIQFYSILFNRVLSGAAVRGVGEGPARPARLRRRRARRPAGRELRPPRRGAAIKDTIE